MSELKKPIENSLESLSMTIPFSCRDWGQEKRDAWVFGIVCGWGDDCRAEFKKKFGWNAETFDRLKRLHAHFEEVRRAQPENEPITNDVLTRDELYHLDGEPLYVMDGEGHECYCVVNTKNEDCIDNEAGAWCFEFYDMTGDGKHGLHKMGWRAYRTKPERSEGE